jgi:hypothetical protein
MAEQQEQLHPLTGEVALPTAPDVTPAVTPDVGAPAEVAAPEVEVKAVTPDDPAAEDWHVQAGRKGARRVHQLVQLGKRYEAEHGLKRGRQRLRQLIELGKRYEQEHGLRPARPKRRGIRLARADRDELLATLLECLLRLAKPSFRGELLRLAAALSREEGEHGHAA